MKSYLGIDIGGGSFDFIMGSREDIRRDNYVTEEIEAEQDPNNGMRKIIETARKISFGYDIERVGVSVTSGDSRFGGMKMRPPMLPRWEGVKIRGLLEDALQCEVRLDHDVIVGLLGEYEFGHKNNNTVWFYIGSGIGVAIMHEGQIYKKRNGEHPEVGHTTYSPTFDKSPRKKEFYDCGARCECGLINDAVATISGNGIRKVYGMAAEEISDLLVWEEIGQNLGQVLANVVHTYCPDLIVMSGAVSVGAGDKLLRPAISYLDNLCHQKSLLLSMPKIKLTAHGNKTTLIGTLALAMEAQYEK